MNYHLDPSKTNIVYQQLGADYEDRIIAPTIQESVKASVAKFDAEELIAFGFGILGEHKQQDIRTKGECCFNHIIGLPQKDGNDKPLYDYEGIVLDSLVTRDGNNNSPSGNNT